MDKPHEGMVYAIGIALDAGGVITGDRDDAAQVTAAAAPIMDWLAAAEDEDDLELRAAAADRHLRNVQSAWRDRRMAVPAILPAAFLAAAQVLYEAHRAVAVSWPACRADLTGTAP